MRIVIVGATSAIAVQCARIWGRESATDFVLLGRDKERTERVAADLVSRNPENIAQVIELDFLDPHAILRTVDEIAATRTPDIVLIAHGSLPDQETCQNDLTYCADAMEINGISPLLCAEAFAGMMATANRGTLALIGSVAGDRGRKSNYVYGAAKGMIARYAEGLQHRFAGAGVKIVHIKPGPTDTPMTAHLKAQGSSLAAADTVALQIVNAIRKGRSVAYVPAHWWIIMRIIRHLPAFVFNRLNI